MRRVTFAICLGAALIIPSLAVTAASAGQPAVVVKDPGPRGGPAGAGDPLPGTDQNVFGDAQSTFVEIDTVPTGLGPRFNADSCAACHAHPSVGGSSPPVNPQVGVATNLGAKNTLPPFITLNGPVREARFKRNHNGTADGGVHDLFVITGRSDAPAKCAITQPDFAKALKQKNVIFRIPTPVFGAGLIESITDSTILANQAADALRKQMLGIKGQPNRSGNDGTITRFGWKAQNKSLLIFSGEAYNVEQGVTNEAFTQEREEDPNCATNSLPEDHTHFDKTAPLDVSSDVVKFAAFARMLAPPMPGDQTSAEVKRGRAVFDSVGCGMCHTPTLHTGNASTAALANQDANLYSDLLVHRMGNNLADGVSQGGANGYQFRSAPLWGVGQRLFFLHDGRTSDLVEAIKQHSGPGSEANRVIQNFDRESAADQNALLKFLRSL